MTYVAAVNEALRQCLAVDDDIFLAGEDIGRFGGVFGTTRGLQAEFGERRVVDTPIAENGIVGLAVGAAATGLRPVVEIMFMDFLTCCMDQVVNQMAKMRYMFGGKATLPITIRTMGGAGMSFAAQHSQSLEAWLCHVPGLKVVMPATPHDVKGLLVAAIRDDNPVVVIENKLSLGMTGDVPAEMYEVAIGKANVVRRGDDVTVVAIGRMVGEALAAADLLAGEQISVEVIDPRSLLPFDTATVLESLARTHRCVVVHEAVRFGGIGAEIAAQLQEEGFDELDAPIHRVGAPFTPVPFSPALEQRYVPDAGRIAAEIRRQLGTAGHGS
jgi:pyruvate/2-oxoglutarate/acetoin dehydrogenase E1 component